MPLVTPALNARAPPARRLLWRLVFFRMPVTPANSSLRSRRLAIARSAQSCSTHRWMERSFGLTATLDDLHVVADGVNHRPWCLRHRVSRREALGALSRASDAPTAPRSTRRPVLAPERRLNDAWSSGTRCAAASAAAVAPKTRDDTNKQAAVQQMWRRQLRCRERERAPKRNTLNFKAYCKPTS